MSERGGWGVSWVTVVMRLAGNQTSGVFNGQQWVEPVQQA